MLNFLGYFLDGFHVFVSAFYHVNLKLLVYLDFQGIMILLLSVLLLNIHTLFFLTIFFLLNVSFIVSFVNKLSFMFPLALLIFILLSIFWYSWIVYFLYIYLLFRYLSNLSPRAFRSKFKLWIFCNFLLSKVFFNLYW